MTIFRTLCLVFVVILPLQAAHAAGEQQDKASEAAALRKHLEQEYPGVTIDSIRKTPLDGIYEVVSGTDVMYVSADGRYLLQGSLIDLESERNLTQRRRGDLVRRKVEAVGEDTMLVYPPGQGEAKHRITVFTDPTCPYCRRLHKDLLELRREHPVEIRYLMFPRGGLESEGAEQLRRVWCSDDPQQAMTAAKRGQSFPEDTSCDTPIKRHFELAREVGVSGTPYVIIGDDGPVFSGYRPKSEIKSLLGIGNASAQADTGG